MHLVLQETKLHRNKVIEVLFSALSARGSLEHVISSHVQLFSYDVICKQSINHISLRHRSYKDEFQSLLGLMNCIRVTGRWGQLSCTKKKKTKRTKYDHR